MGTIEGAIGIPDGHRPDITEDLLLNLCKEREQRIEDLEKSKEDAVDVCRALIDLVTPLSTVADMAKAVVGKEDDEPKQEG